LYSDFDGHEGGDWGLGARGWVWWGNRMMWVGFWVLVLKMP
jgi:hypothetical protein